jgi:hypothetical protein
VTIAPLPSGGFQVDSFFDITYRVGPAGGPYSVDSFFDVFTEIEISPPTNNPDGSQTFDTEMLSMDLSGAPGQPSGNDILGLSSVAEHRGHVTILKSPAPGGGSNYHIDSFFDIFTELSIDGGNMYAPPSSSTPMAGSVDIYVPEPSTAVLLALGSLIAIGIRRRVKRK